MSKKKMLDAIADIEKEAAQEPETSETDMPVVFKTIPSAYFIFIWEDRESKFYSRWINLAQVTKILYRDNPKHMVIHFTDGSNVQTHNEITISEVLALLPTWWQSIE